MSQIFEVGPSFYSMKSRKIIIKKYQKSSRFLTLTKTRTYITILRQSSLKTIVINTIVKF